jgi:hypothetical protein
MRGKAGLYLALTNHCYNRAMSMEFDRKTRWAALAASRFDWHGLRARFAAGHALRGAPEYGEAGPGPVARGSFDRGSARLLAVYGKGAGPEQEGVNPTASGNGNPPCDNDAAVAGAFVAGDRG